jgi:hypothetical protein
MKKFFYYFWFIIFDIIIIDIMLSFIFVKEINSILLNKIDIIESWEKHKIINYNANTEKINGYDVPYWTAEYRGPFFWYKKDKLLSCRILWIGDSIIYWSQVDWKNTYLNILSNKIKNTEIINKWVPWYDLLQEIMSYYESWLGDSTDLLIWHLWEDDYFIYKLINWILYDSNVYVNWKWEPELFNFIPKEINSFLIKKSYLYNNLLKIKMNYEIKLDRISNNSFVIQELDKLFKDYLSKWNNKKILILLSPRLRNDSFNWSWRDKKGYQEIYKNIEESFSWTKSTSVIYLDRLLEWVSVKDISNDNICHFNEKWHQIIADKLYDYIKTNKLLDDKCY